MSHIHTNTQRLHAVKMCAGQDQAATLLLLCKLHATAVFASTSRCAWLSGMPAWHMEGFGCISSDLSGSVLGVRLLPGLLLHRPTRVLMTTFYKLVLSPPCSPHDDTRGAGKDCSGIQTCCLKLAPVSSGCRRLSSGELSIQ